MNRRIVIQTSHSECLVINERDTIQMFHILSRAQVGETSLYSDTVKIAPRKTIGVKIVDSQNIIDPEPAGTPTPPLEPSSAPSSYSDVGF